MPSVYAKVLTVKRNALLKFFQLILLLIFSFSGAFAQTNTYTAVSGGWNTAGNWSLTHIPAAGEDVVIPATSTVSVDVSPIPATGSIGSLTVSGTLNFSVTTARTINVTNNVTINTGGTIAAPATTTAAHTLTIGGNFNIAGTFTGAGAAKSTINTAVTGDINITGTASNVLGTTTSCANLTVGDGTAASKLLTNAAGITTTTLTVSGNTTINTLASFASGAAGTSTCTLSVGGNFTNNGTFNALAFASNKINTTFTGAANNSFTTAAAASTTFNLITLNKGTSNTSVLDFNPSNTVSFPATGALAVTNGTFKLNGSVTISNPILTAAYTIPATGGFWLNNANATVTGQTTAAIAGSLRVSQGIYNVTTTTAINSGAAVLVDGGTLNLTGAVTMAAAAETLTVTSGTCALGGALTIGANAGSVVLVNGGTLTTAGAVTANGKLEVSSNTCTIASTLTATNALSNILVDGGTLNVNGATATFGTAGSSLQISSGNLNVGTAANSDLVLTTGANVQITGGVVNVAGKLRVNLNTAANTITYNQSTGTVYVATLGGSNNATFGSFDMGISTSTSFTFSGGKIVVAQGQVGGTTNVDFRGPISTAATIATSGTGYVQFGTPAVTAVTPNVAITAAGTVFRINGGVLPSFTLNADSDPGITQAAAIVVKGDMTLNGAGAYNSGTFGLTMSGNSATQPGNITVAGTNAMTLNSATSSVLTFNSSFANQSISLGSGSIVSNQLGGLTIGNNFSTVTPLSTVTIPAGLTMIDGATLTLTAGILNTALLTMGTSNTTTISGGGTASYMNGALIRTLIVSTAIGTANFFPVGKNDFYMPINLAPVLTGLVQLKAEAFTNGTGTSISPSVAETYTHYWKAENVSATPANLTSVAIREGDANIVSSNLILKSVDKSLSSYNSIIPATSTFATGTPNTIVSTFIANADFMAANYYAFGTACTALGTITGPGTVCIGAVSQLSNASAHTGTWSSSNPAVATIDASGNVTGVATGTTTITFTDANGAPCTGLTYTKNITVTSCSVLPGGVGNNLISWYKGDAGLSTTAWTDQSGNNTLTANSTPSVNSSSLNFNPVATLDGTGSYYYTPSATGWLGGSNASTYFYVATSTSASGSRTVYGKGASSSTTVSAHAGQSTTSLRIAAAGLGTLPVTANGAIGITTPTWATQKTNLSRSGFNGGTPAAYYISANGSTSVNSASTIAGVNIDGASRFHIGSNVVAANFWGGDIAEVIAFNGKQANTDYNRIESYLALKYGISLDQTTAQNYIASNGATKMWDASAAATGFNKNIFGIGRDNATGGSGLDQRIAQSANAGSLFTVATINEFTLTNQDVSRTSLSNLNFETFADNAGTNTWTFTGAKPGYKILSRQWQVQETGTIGNVYVQFDTANAAFTIPARVVTSSPLYILTDPNADGDYSDGTATPLTNTGGSVWSSAIDFVNLTKFTLATVSPYAGLDTFVCSSGSKLYNLTGVGPAGIWSADVANPAGAVLGTTAGGIATVDFTTAALGDYNFIYTLGGATDMVKISYSGCYAPGGVFLGLQLWLDASKTPLGSFVNGTGWQDNSINHYDFSQVPNSPQNLSNQLNFNNSVYFNGSTYLRRFVAPHYVTANTAGEIYSILQSANPGIANGHAYDLGGPNTAGPVGPSYGINNVAEYFGTTDPIAWNPVTGVITDTKTGVAAVNYTGIKTDKWNLYNVHAAVNDWAAAFNGRTVAASSINTTSFTIYDFEHIGARSGIVWQGKMPELILYNKVLTASERQKVNSYVALKYGITLDQTTATNYLASDGATNMWNASAAATGFNNNIFGIGRDDQSTLNQKVSQSANSDGGVLTLATDNNFSLGNQDAGRTTSLTDLNFETFADNNGANTWTFTGAKSGYKILQRQWQVQETGTISTVYAQFDTANATFPIPARGNVSLPFYLLTDPNADGDYNDGTATPLTNTSGSVWSTAIDFSNGSKFVLAIRYPNAGVDTFICNTGSKLYTLTGNDLTGIWSASAVNPAGISLGSSVGGIATADFTTATPGAYYFIYTAAGIADTVKITYSDCKAPGGVHGATLWVKANDNGGVATDGTAVTNLGDKSADNKTITASATAPVFKNDAASMFNYNPTLYFNGSNSNYTTSSVLETNTVKEAAVYVVHKTIGSGSGGGLFGEHAGTTTGNERFMAHYPFVDGTAYWFLTNGATINWSTMPSLPTGSVDLSTFETSAANNTKTFASMGKTISSSGDLTYSAIAGANAPFYIGSATPVGTMGPDFYSNSNIAEIMVYPTGGNRGTDRFKIESYLALKYGLTLDINGANGGNYILSNNTTAWNASVNPAYHNQVIGIVRDDASALLQKQSHTQDDALRIFTGTLAANNASNAGTISNNLSSIIIGSDGGSATMSTLLPMPAGITNRFGRTWKITNNNFNGSFSLEIKWDSASLVYLSKFRLLVSHSANFSGASVYGPTDGVVFSAGSIIISGLNSSIITPGDNYITVGATTLTLLPVGLSDFNASLIGKKVDISWQTSFETNNDYFIVEKSVNQNDWEKVAILKAAGNSSSARNYSTVDYFPYNGVSYYRLKQVNADGSYSYSEMRTVKRDNAKNSFVVIYPNPASGQVTIKGDATELGTMAIYNVAGQDVTNMISTLKIINTTSTQMLLDVSRLSPGVYNIKTVNSTTKLVKK